MIIKFFIIFCALLGAWYILPVWYPNMRHVAFEWGDFQFKYRHIICAIILICGWKLKTD